MMLRKDIVLKCNKLEVSTDCLESQNGQFTTKTKNEVLERNLSGSYFMIYKWRCHNMMLVAQMIYSYFLECNILLLPYKENHSFILQSSLIKMAIAWAFSPKITYIASKYCIKSIQCTSK